MICDRVENFGLYFPGNRMGRVLEFLRSLSPETGEGEYELEGRDMFARVMSYETRGPEEAALEAHRDYIDVQTVIEGAEGIAWHPVGSLRVSRPYDAAKDVEFYERPPDEPARVNVAPGLFVALFPQDAHMPQLAVGGSRRVIKKAVVKVRVGLAR